MRVLCFLISAFIVSGCMSQLQMPMKKSDSAKAQQAKAEAAQKEMEKDIQNGTPSLDFAEKPVKPTPKPAPPKTPAPMFMPKPVEGGSKPLHVSSLKPQTKYPMKNGFPVWFTTPVYDGYIGAVGIAPKQPRGGYAAQKRVARMQAQKNLAKQIRVLVKSELTVESLNVDTSTVNYYREKVSSLTVEQADEFLQGFKVMDEWIDEKSGEYYMWMIIEK